MNERHITGLTASKGPKRSRRQLTRQLRNNLEGMLLVIPALLLITIFAIIPMIYALFSSVYDVSLYTGTEFVGFENYQRVLHDTVFWSTFKTAFRYMLYVIPASLLLAFMLANLMIRIPKKAAGIFKASIYIPNVISGVITSVIFIFIYDYDSGLANVLLEKIGIKRIGWVTDTKYAMLAVAIPAIWMSLGGTTLIMLSGLNDIPTVYYEAASIDGANAFQQLYKITLPSMRNVFIYLLVTSIVGSMQVFELPNLITHGGPLYSTTTPNLHIYTHFINDTSLGYTVAASLVIFLLLAGLTAVIFRLISSEKSME